MDTWNIQHERRVHTDRVEWLISQATRLCVDSQAKLAHEPLKSMPTRCKWSPPGGETIIVESTAPLGPAIYRNQVVEISSVTNLHLDEAAILEPSHPIYRSRYTERKADDTLVHDMGIQIVTLDEEHFGKVLDWLIAVGRHMEASST